MTAFSERSLVDSLRRCDKAAFDRAYAEYGSRLFRFILRLVRRRDIAEDLYQETWMALARSAPSLREDTDLAAWLFTVARNECRSHRRWSLLDVSRFVVMGDEAYPSSDAGPDVTTESSMAMARLERALLDLHPTHREVLLLVVIEGLSQERVATILGTTYEAVRQRLTRARAALAQRLAAIEKSPSMGLLCRGTPR